MSPGTQPNQPALRRAYRSPTAWLTLLCLFAVGLSADLYSKAWSFRTVAGQPVVLDRNELLANPDHNPVDWRQPGRPLLPWGLLRLKLVLNPGAVFGIGAHQRWFFIVFTIAALAAGLAIVDVESAEAHDRNSMFALPMRKYLEFEKVWALRDYQGFARDLLAYTEKDA